MRRQQPQKQTKLQNKQPQAHMHRPSSSSRSSTRSSLLGIPQRDGDRVLQTHSEQLLDQQNEKKVEELTQSVGRIKQIALDIESGVAEGNSLLQALENQMGQVQGLLKGTMKKLDGLRQQGGSRHMCYLILFIVLVFLILYWLIR